MIWGDFPNGKNLVMYSNQISSRNVDIFLQKNDREDPLNFKAFYEVLLEAKCVNPEETVGARIDKGGRKLSQLKPDQGKENIINCKVYKALLDSKRRCI